MERPRVSLSGEATRQLGVSVRLLAPSGAPPYLRHDRRRGRRGLLAMLLVGVGVVALMGLIELAQRPSAAPLAAAVPVAAPAAVVEPPALVSAQPEPAPAAPEPAPAQAEVVAPIVAAVAAPVAAPAVVPAPSGGRLRIPRIGVDAPLITLGLAANGQMPAPPDDSSVAWYDFSAAPGGPGNAMLAGHVDWVDHAAVFWHLRTVTPGDTITVTSAGQTFLYVVDRVYYVPFNIADTTGIVGRRSGPPTLTIVTCAGTFDTARHLYDQRLVVVSSLRA